MQTVILCGGLGTRLSEETGLRPKPMVSIGTRPMLWHIMNIYGAQGFNQFTLALGYKGEMIKEYFLNYYNLSNDFEVNLKDGNVSYLQKNVANDWKVRLVDTGEKTMTGGRVKRLEKHLRPTGTFMLTYGDGVCDIDLKNLLKFHKAHGKLVTVTAVRPTARFGGLKIEGERVLNFKEKPQSGEGWINGGFFVIEPEFFDYIEGDSTVLELSPLERAVQDGQLMAYKHEGFWQCMDTIREKQMLEDLWAKGDAPWARAGQMKTKAAKLRSTFQGRKVLITGHTGFKGAWLSQWVHELGAEVCGYSKAIPTEPSAFKILGLDKKIRHELGDVRDLSKLQAVFADFSPEVVFHMAAQPLVRDSYEDPKGTFDTNVGGTVNVLECVRRSPSLKAAVFVATDKCYENIESREGYRETDRLGGKDPYSASKACAEIVFGAYFKSFLSIPSGPKVASVRGGNVIGGGDWAKDRIVPDCVRAWQIGETVKIRSPHAVRPWQHVLEAIGGYIDVAVNLLEPESKINGESFNFGPHADSACSVQTLLDEMKKSWPKANWALDAAADTTKKEAQLLYLNCDKAFDRLGWKAGLSLADTVRWTADWYRTWSEKGAGAVTDLTLKQIREYQQL